MLRAFDADVDVAVLADGDAAAEQLVRSLTADGYGLGALSAKVARTAQGEGADHLGRDVLALGVNNATCDSRPIRPRVSAVRGPFYGRDQQY